MKVCLANDSFPPLYDGVANTVLNYAEIIEKKYGHAMVATPAYPGVTDSYPFSVVRYRSFDTVRAFGYRTGDPFDPDAVDWLSGFGPDILHSHCPVMSTVLLRHLRNLTGAPLVFTYHTKFDIEIGRGVKLGIIKNAAIKAMIDNIEACDEVWAVNKGAGENLVSLGYTGKYRVMPNGVGFPRGPVGSEETEKISEKHGLPDGVPCFLFVGRMMWYKGQRIILDGLASMRKRGYDFRMIFIGDGVDFDAISEYSRNLGLGDRVFFTGAIRDKELLRAYYSRADLFILPSVFDNNPIVCKEAAACATASVLIRDSSPAEGVTDGKNGMLIEEDPDSLASALEKIYSDPTLTRRLGDGALNDLYVSWEDMMKEVTARYAEIIAAAKNHDLRPRKKELSDVAVSLMSDTYTRLSNVREFFRNYI